MYKKKTEIAMLDSKTMAINGTEIAYCWKFANVTSL